MTLGETILTLRKRQKLSQEDVGAILGVSRQAVSKWETDQSLPDTGNLLALAKLFGVTVEELTGARPPAAEEVKEEASPIGIVADLPWADDASLHAVLYQGHRLLQSEGIPERNGGGLLHLLAGRRDAQQVVLRFTGTARDIYSDFAVHCEGEVSGSIQAGDGVQCGSVGGNINAGDGVTCGAVEGSVRAGDSVQCESVGGSVQAGDGVHCGDVGGSVQAGDGVTCGNVEGNVSAGESVRCGNVGGDVRANDSVHIQGSVGGEIQSE